MSEAERIVLTAATTILGGLVVFVGGQIASRFFIIEPWYEQRKVIGSIAEALLRFEALFASSGEVPREVLEPAVLRLRELSEALLARTIAIPRYGFFASLGYVLPLQKIHEVSRGLIRLSNTVAFANAVRSPRVGILCLGVERSGKPLGLSNLESTQQKVLSWLDECYPPLPFYHRTLEVEGKDVLAVVVEESPRPPHFVGPAFVRIGSRSEKASEEMLRRLAESRLDKVRLLREWEGKNVTIRAISALERIVLGGIYSSGSVPKQWSSFEASLTEVTAHWLRWVSSDERELAESAPIEEILLSWDPEKNRVCITVTSESRPSFLPRAGRSS